MEKRMKEIRVSTTNDGTIELWQEDFSDPDQFPIVIDAEQVDLLVKWLLDAKEEVLGHR